MGIKKYNYSFSISNKIINSFVFLKKTEDEIVVFSPYCTHLGCLIKWNSISNEFICSCHGGKFDKDGKVIAGPPPTPLERLPYQIKNGKIYIEIKTYE
ncbi:MAG: ubiquinol-cytochrome c reductase iron-sulfur subunit [Thermodesulfovibrionales bacterium]|nr:ubiquinol-cytochrome c reductase iron-sulfur subunit [Thermodesulfovibrionales bacterium]